MGSNWYCLVIWIVFYASCTIHTQASENSTRDSLDTFLHDYAIKNMPRHHTGRLYSVPLPANLSDIEVSIVRLRTRRLWKNGANFSSVVEIPRRVLPWPFTRRVDLVYQNLGNSSSVYYSVPNYTMVTPVVGFLAYDSNANSTSGGLLELNVTGADSFVVRFPNITAPDQQENATMMMCVRFDTNGTLEFRNVSGGNSCVSQRLGRFAIVVPYDHRHQPGERKRKKVLKWWVFVIAGIFVALFVFVVLGIVGYKLMKSVRMRRMERESVISEGLDTVWIAGSRMPSASSIRTQPELEESYIP